MGTPAAFYNNAVDLNRYSNKVARQIIRTYNDVILDAVGQLAVLDDMTAPMRAARLRAILADLKQSLDGWAGDATALTVEELQGLAVLQTEFVEEELRKALPIAARDQIRSVQVTPGFAQAVAVTDPTAINVVALSDDLQAAVTGAPATFRLTAAQGATITLPNGRVLEKSFRGLAESNAEMFGRVVRTGFIQGKSIQRMSRELKGRLRFGQPGSGRQIALAGGEVTKLANHQMLALVRTSVNQVANAASQASYKANQDVTKRYIYTATLDNRTSAICRALDGREFEYGKGPTPPQHFNCRSTTVPIIDYEGLGVEPPPRSDVIDDRQTYGEWLAKQTDARKAEILGSKGRAKIFDGFAEKVGPKEAIRRFVREDGSELSLADLERKLKRTKGSTAAKSKPKPKPKKVKTAPAAESTLKPITAAGFKKAYQGNGQLNLGEVYDQQGFNAKSELVKDMDQLLARKDLVKDVDGQDNLIFFRGIPEKSSVDQWQGRGSQAGIHYPGKGVYGNGSYMAAAGQSGKYSVEAAHSTATSYASDKRSLVTASGLKKDARIWRTSIPVPKDNPDLDRAANNKARIAARMEAHNEWEKWSLDVVKEAKAKYGEDLNDIGEAAAALGYDGYQVPMANHGRGGSEDYWVILNRGSLVSIDGPSPIPATRFAGDKVVFEPWEED